MESNSKNIIDLTAESRAQSLPAAASNPPKRRCLPPTVLTTSNAVQINRAVTLPPSRVLPATITNTVIGNGGRVLPSSINNSGSKFTPCL